MSSILFTLLSHLLDGFFIHGTTPGRIFLFISYLFVCAGAYFLSKKIPEKYFFDIKVLAFSSCIAFVSIGLVSQVYLFSHLGIPQTAQVHFFSNEEYTLSRLVHSHVGKLALTPLVQAVPSFTADIGAALLPFFVPWISWGMSVLFILMVISSAFAGRPYVQYASTRLRKIGMLCLYGLFAYIVISSAVDGGIVEGYVLALYVGYAAMLFAPPRWFVLFLIGGGVLGICFSFLLLCFPSLPYGVGSALLGSAHISIFLIGAGAFFLAIIYRKKNLLLSSISGIVLLSIGIGNGMSSVTYLTRTVDSNHSFIASYNDLSAELRFVDRIGNLRIFTLEDGKQTTVQQLAETYQLSWWYAPVSFCSQTRDVAPASSEDMFMIGVFEKPEIVSYTTPLASIVLSFDHMKGGMYWYRAAIRHRECLPEPAIIVRELVRSLGLSPFVFVAYHL